MAKQLGYSEDELKAMQTGDSLETFDEPVRAALRLAEAITVDAHKVGDELYAEARRYYSEAEVVELACVIGLTNYFNRFTTALRVDPSGSSTSCES